MADREIPVENDELQFDRVVPEAAAAPIPGGVGVECSCCHSPIGTEYYTANGHVCCARCRHTIEEATTTPPGVLPLVRAGLFGLGAGVAGAAVYYAVIAIAHLEIGLVAILIGYMVGRAVRKGARGRGGLRFQILAAALTYASVALAYTPLVVNAIGTGPRTGNPQASAANRSNDVTVTGLKAQGAAISRPSAGTFLLGLAMLLGFFAALPVLVVFGSLPFGLLSALIIFVGMRQAWRLTAALSVDVLGPYRVGAASPAST
jgi:hypothetical protein